MRALVLAAIGLVLVAGPGCRRGDIREARRLLEVAAHQVELLDLEIADLYAQKAAECLASSGGWEEYDSCVAPWDLAVTKTKELRRGLFSVQAGLDTWVASKDSASFKRASCQFFELVEELRTLLSRHGAEVQNLDYSGVVKCSS